VIAKKSADLLSSDPLLVHLVKYPNTNIPRVLMRQTRRSCQGVKRWQLEVIHYTVLRNCTEKRKKREGRNNYVRRKNENERTEGGGTEREK